MFRSRYLGPACRALLLALILTTLFSAGCSKDNTAWHLNHLNLSTAWETSDGSGIIIAFLDSGISTTLYNTVTDRIVKSYDIPENDSDATDDIGHGTAMISAACGNKKTGVSGIAPKAYIMPIDVVGEDGLVDQEDLADGIYWAVDHNADIICLSLGSNSLSDDVEYSLIYANEHGVISVAAAGDHSDNELLFPAFMPGIIAVASEDKDGTISDFSNYDEDKDPLFLIPGEDIDTLTIDDNGNTVIRPYNGTSVSCALLAGIIALGLQVRPDASLDLVTDSLENSYQGNFLDVSVFLKALSVAVDSDA